MDYCHGCPGCTICVCPTMIDRKPGDDGNAATYVAAGREDRNG